MRRVLLRTLTAGRPTDANVVFSKSGHEFVCEATVHLSTGLTAQAKAHAHEIYATFDACAEKMDKQLRRYKRRLKDHHKERATPVELSDVGEAVMQMELAGAPVLVFRNEKQDTGVNIVYRRDDGNIGWIDPN